MGVRASHAATADPITLSIVAVAGFVAGWVLPRYLAGARTRRELLRPPWYVEELAYVLADRFGDQLLDDPTADELERVVRQSIVTIAAVLAGFLLVVLIARDLRTVLLATGACGALTGLEIGEALVAYGLADDPLPT